MRKRRLNAAVSLLWLFFAVCHAAVAQSKVTEQAPRLLSARGEDGKVTLAFTPVAEAQAYAVRVVAEDGTNEIIRNVEVADYSVHGLNNGINYRFSVCAMFDGREGRWSNELSARPVAEPEWDALREAFTSANPTRNSNPFTMIHGDETEAELRKIMRVAYEAGFEGVTLHPYTYKDYLGPGQWDRWKIIFDQARRLGLVVWQQDDLNYPSGFAAGKVVAAHPEFGRTKLVEAAQQVLEGPQKSFTLDVHSLLQGRDFLVAISAFPEDGEPLDLTDRAVGGKLSWDVPAGRWRLFVVKAVWCGPMGVAGTSGPMPFVDFMNPRAADAYIEAVYQASYDHFGPEFGRTFKGFFSDEAPVDFAQFTPDFLERFEKAKGYSLRKWLPAVFHDLTRRDGKIRGDYRDFIREQNTTVFFGRSRRWCREHGVQLIGHVIEDHRQDMRRLELLDLPGFDNVFVQWYKPEPDVYWRMPKMTSSVAHYGGSRNDIALVEHFAATGWQTGLTEMKRMMDWSTAMGMNQIVPCGLDTQSPPSWEVTPDFWLHGKNPQWPYFPKYQAAANRMTMLMRGGRHVAPAIVLDTTESKWAEQSTDLSCPHGASDGLWKSCKAMCEAQVDFDLIPYYVFSNSARTVFDKSCIRIDKEDYGAVIVADVERIPADVAERLREFYDAGGIVVAINLQPNASCSGEEDERVQAAVAGIWGEPASRRGKSAVADFDGLRACLTDLDVPDVRISSRTKQLLYCHRRLHGRELYFFANTGTESITTAVELHGVSGVPSLWDPVSGRIVEVSNYSRQNGVLKLTLPFGEYESMFVVVEPNAERRPLTAEIPSPQQEMLVAGPWQARDESGACRRFFSTDLSLPDDWPAGLPARLELQGASQVILLKVNGKSAGERFCTPYRFEVGDHLRAGGNRIEVVRIGRYSSPVEIKNMGKLSFTDDMAAAAPCRRAILVSRLKNITPKPAKGASVP